ncbi:hypothetical protein Tco_1044132 [Tanacetum coccineum]|uniref:Uncharacterized protein n=1 Tax=Tanacetum coccineum TaxID=301880 RepID=A0ABQ5GR92_9ASTR
MCQTPRQIKIGRDTKIPQSSGPPKKVGDEAVHKMLGDRMERAATTDSSLEAEQDSEQSWQTASLGTLENGDMEITATIDGKVKVVSEASIRRHLKLEDSDGISTLLTTEIFEQLALMGNMKRASKGYTGVDTPLFQTMLVQGQILQGEGSTIPETEIPQPSSPTQTYAADEDASTGVDVRHGGDATTVSSLDAGQGSDRVAVLENDLKQTKKTYGAAFTKLIKKVKTLEKIIKSSKARRRAQFVLSDDEEEDSFNQGRKNAEIDEDPDISLVYTAEPYISTANVPVSTAEESQRIASVHKEASTFKPKEWDNIQAQIEANEELAHRLQAQEREGYSEADKTKLLHMGSHTLQQLRRYSFDEIKFLFEATMKRVNAFTPMESDDTVPKVVAGSSKRSIEEQLGEESSKRQKIGKGSEPAEESKDKESDELSQEQLQQLIIIVPEERMNVEALQTKYPIIDWEVYTEDSRTY